LLSAILFPAPTTILTFFWQNLLSGEYAQDILVSVSRLLTGFAIGGSAGLLLGMLMGWSRRIREVLDPIIAALHPVPKFALLPMAIVFFGLGEASRAAMVSIGAFFPLLINTMGGVRQINPTYYEVVQNYGASQLDIFQKVVLPGSLPSIMTGARLSLKASLSITIGIEMVFGNSGLGSVLWLAWQTMRMTHLYSVLIIVSVIGVGIAWVLEKTKVVLLPWSQYKE